MKNKKRFNSDTVAMVAALIVFVIGAITMIGNPDLFTQVLNPSDINLTIEVNDQEVEYDVISERSSTLQEPGFLYVDVPVGIENPESLIGPLRIKVTEQTPGNFLYATAVDSASAPVNVFEQEGGAVLVIDPEDVDRSPATILAVMNRYGENFKQLDYEIFLNFSLELTSQAQ